MKLKEWMTRVLLGFALVTAGFSLGRQTAPRPESVTHNVEEASESKEDGESALEERERSGKLVVYSVHMTFRCWECNQIEWLARELIEKEFAEELTSGRIEFRLIDYMKDLEFARRYNIASSTLLLVRLVDGQEAGFERLDEVWTRSRNREDFRNYVRNAIRSQLGQLPEGTES